MFKLTRIIPFLPIEISRIKQPKRSMNSASPKRVSFDVKKKTPPKSKDIDNNKSDLGKAGTFKAVFKKDRT